MRRRSHMRALLGLLVAGVCSMQCGQERRVSLEEYPARLLMVMAETDKFFVAGFDPATGQCGQGTEEFDSTQVGDYFPTTRYHSDADNSWFDVWSCHGCPEKIVYWTGPYDLADRQHPLFAVVDSRRNEVIKYLLFQAGVTLDSRGRNLYYNDLIEEEHAPGVKPKYPFPACMAVLRRNLDTGDEEVVCRGVHEPIYDSRRDCLVVFGFTPDDRQGWRHGDILRLSLDGELIETLGHVRDTVLGAGRISDKWGWFSARRGSEFGPTYWAAINLETGEIVKSRRIRHLSYVVLAGTPQVTPGDQEKPD